MNKTIPLALMAASALAAACTSPLTTSSAPTVPAPPLASTCDGFSDALRACAPAACAQQHPIMPSFTIEHRITGSDGDACLYAQSMPGEMRMVCRFSAEGREDVAAQMEDMFSGRQTSFSFTLSDAHNSQQTALTRECTIEDRTGATIPWGVSER